MADHEESNDPYYVSPKEMQGWLEREATDIKRAAELRLGEAARVITDYANGATLYEEMSNRLDEYKARWGEALPGVTRSAGLTDEQILKRITKVRIDQGAMEPDALRRVKYASTRRSR